MLLWLQARIAAADPGVGSSPEEIGDDFGSAARILQGHGAVPWAGRCLLDHATAAAAGSATGDAVALAEEALEHLRPLRVTSWVIEAEGILAAARGNAVQCRAAVRPPSRTDRT
jgi:hypothetical protein